MQRESVLKPLGKGGGLDHCLLPPLPKEVMEVARGCEGQKV